MRKDLVIIPDDQPGVLARLGETLGAAGLNIEGVSAFTGGGKGVVHILVDDADRAIELLRAAGFEVKSARDVLVVSLQDVAGQLGAFSRSLADAGVNIEQAYVASHNRIVIACDDVARAREVLGMQE